MTVNPSFLIRSFCFSFVLFIPAILVAQVDINEVVTANLDLLFDEDGEPSDWFELFNTTSSDVNIQGYRVTDNNDPNRWVFPTAVVPANGRLLVFASGKDRVAPEVDHWETVITEDDVYQYFEGTAEPTILWNTMAGNVTNWSTGPGGLGAGDNDDATQVTPGLPSLYIRRIFNVPDPDKIVNAILSMDYDDGFVAYLNGVEIARRFVVGNPTYSTLASVDHEAQVYQGGPYETILVDQATFQSALVDGFNVFAVEVHNFSLASLDMTIRSFLHFGISDGSTFFDPIPAFFQSPTVFGLHTNFKLNPGETLRLRSADGLLVSSVTIPSDLQPGHARARIPDGGPFCYTSSPTPAQPNSGVCVTAYAQTPIFSTATGFYGAPQVVSIAGNTVRFSLNGSEPTATSPLYTSPIMVDSTMFIRAKSFEPGKLPSATANGNYFIAQPTTLPVVSISADPAILFGENGVYDAVPQGGGLPRVPCHVQYYDADKTLAFENPAGFQVIGNFTLLYPQKGMEFTCKDRFGSPETMQHVIFPQDKPNIDRFNDFRIKNADNETTRMRDLVANRMAAPTHNVVAGFGNVAAYINGRYWGHFNSRERLDENFFARNFNVDPDSVDIVKSVSFTPEFFDVSNGTSDAFFEMSDLLINNDLSIPTNYANAAAVVDIENWIDYYATRIYLSDYDWMWQFQNNTMLFKSHSPDLKWKYVIWDCANTQGASVSAHPELDYVTNIFADGYASRHKDMINALLANDGFRDLFINRFADLMNYYYTNARIFSIIDSNLAEMLPEMNAHQARWGTGSASSITSATNSELRAFHQQRPAFQRSHLENYFGLDGQVDITLRALPAGWGRVQISTITPTVEELPWTGRYFHGVPVTVTAIPEPGYEFVDWDNNSNIADTLSASFTRDFAAGTTLTARFRSKITSVPEVGASTLRIHPNPTVGVVIMEADGPLRYTVQDPLGRVVSANTREEVVRTIDLSRLPDGVYFITTEQHGERGSHRVVKQGSH